MVRRPPITTRTETLFPKRRSSDLVSGIFWESETCERFEDIELGLDCLEFLSRTGPVTQGSARLARSGCARLPEASSFAGRVRNSRPHGNAVRPRRSEEHTSELQSLMRISYAVFCLKKKNTT